MMRWLVAAVLMGMAALWGMGCVDGGDPPSLQFTGSDGGSADTASPDAAQPDGFDASPGADVAAAPDVPPIPCETDQACVTALGTLPACRVARCDPVAGCVAAFVADHSPCDDALPCTTNDACQSGTCVGVAIDCDDDNRCTTDECFAGTCLHEPLPSGSDCGMCAACNADGQCVGDKISPAGSEQRFGRTRAPPDEHDHLETQRDEAGKQRRLSRG